MQSMIEASQWTQFFRKPAGLPLGLMALAALAASMAAPAQAGNLIVKEGETATFEITVTKARTDRYYSPDPRIRVYYSAAQGGTAKGGHKREGADYSTLNPGVFFAQGKVGEPMKIDVRTFSDDKVEADETIKMQITAIKWISGWFWSNSPRSSWNVEGMPDTITIKDRTPRTGTVDWSLCYWGC